MPSRLKDIPELARDGSNLNEVMQAVREALQTFRGYRGDPLDEALTLRKATQRGVLGIDGQAAAGAGGTGTTGPQGPPGESGVVEPDLTPPPTPTGFTATAGITYLYVHCDAQVYTQGHGHDLTRVYGAMWPTGGAEPTFSSAVELFAFQGTFSAYPSNPSTRWCLWIKWQSADGVLSVSPAGGTNGVQATTGLDVSTLVSAMTGTGNPFTILATDTVIDGVTYPAGTYTTRALIMDAQISSAKIKALAVDDGKIANLSAAKLTIGDGTVGGNLKSTVFTSGSAGWLIQPNGNAEFNAVTVRGTVYAAAGLIGGNTIDASGLQSPSYSAGLTGWRLDTSGYLKAYNGAGANQFDLTASGTTPVLKIGTALSILGNGTATFAGALSAATGTFAGTLSAAVGNFKGAVNVGDFTGYAWPAAGGTGAHLSASGLLMGNPNASAGNPGGKYLQIHTPVGGIPAIYTNIPAYIEQAQIGTLQVANEAVVMTRAAAADAVVYLTGANDYMIACPAITIPAVAPNTAIAVVFSLDIRFVTATVQIYRNGTLILQGDRNYMGYTVLDYPGAGTFTYQMYCQGPAGEGGQVNYRSMLVIAVKAQ